MARSFASASSQYLEHGAAVVTSAPLTLACWARCATSGGSGAPMAMSISGTAPTNNLFAVDFGDFAAGDPIRAVAINGATAGVATTSTGYTANTWHHVAAVFASTASRSAYINGGSKGTNTTSVTPASLAYTYISSWRNSGGTIESGALFNGQIAEAGIWSAALDDAEIAALADGYTPLEIRPQSLVAYWPLGGHYGQFDLDRWKNKYDLTAYNSPTWAVHPRVIYPAIEGVWPLAVAGGGGPTIPYWAFARRSGQIIGGGI